MIKKDLPSKSIEIKPLLLRPTGKDYLWGGNNLNDNYSKNLDIRPLAETWECSTHTDGECFVVNGPFAGKTLKMVINDHKEYLGKNNRFCEDLPIMVKLIDAKLKLSIQVHPDDEYAKIHENQLGKTEFWYVLEAKEGAELVYGFNQDVEENTVIKAIEDGSLEKFLQSNQVKKGDVFFIKPGIVHSIGEGIMVAEIQENSNVTYRLYDYNRINKDGKKRELHIKKALDVLDMKTTEIQKQPMRVLKYRPGLASELLCRCEKFQIERLLINTERQRHLMEYRTDNMTFHVLLCINGCGIIKCCDETIAFFKGDCIFFPANTVTSRFHGKAEFLDISC